MTCCETQENNTFKEGFEKAFIRAFDIALDEAVTHDLELVLALDRVLNADGYYSYNDHVWMRKHPGLYDTLLELAKDAEESSFNIRKLACKAYGLDL